MSEIEFTLFVSYKIGIGLLAFIITTILGRFFGSIAASVFVWIGEKLSWSW